MKRLTRAVLAVPVVVFVIALCGLGFGGLGTAVDLILRSKDFSSPYPVRVPLALGLAVFGFLGLFYGLRLLAKTSTRLSRPFLIALTDGVLLIAGFGMLTGLSCLVLAALPRFQSQVRALLVAGCVLCILSAALLFSILLRYRRHRPPTSPRGSEAAEARTPIPETPLKTSAGPLDMA